MINKNDYHQVFEESVMLTAEHYVKWARNANIQDFKQMLIKWIDFYEKK